MKNVAIYLPICMIIFFAVDFAVHRHLKKIETKQQAQEVYFKKYEGSLKRRLNLSLEEAGITREQATKIVNKLNTVLDMRRLAPRDKYLITMAENDNNGFKMLIVTKDFSRYYVAQNNGELIAGIMDISFKERERFVKGDIQNSLFNSMQAVGLKPSFIIDFTDLFSWTIDFNSETRDGDKFALYWEEGYTAGGNTLNETILAAYYDGKVGGRTYAIRFEDDFYDENGKFSKKMFLKSHISVWGVRIYSRFNKG
ncbi:MAG: hypothetical protein LBM71_04130 [Elusimicrobiota bacterium]|nr:hypothetical protein [Elusimicrobiota bacterium]